jgi:ATP-dependent Lon protease
MKSSVHIHLQVVQILLMTESNHEPSQIYPLIPLRGLIVLPHSVTQLDVGREKSIKAVEKAMSVPKYYVVLAGQKDEKHTDPDWDGIYNIGVLADIKQVIQFQGQPIKVVLEGMQRVRIDSFESLEPFISAKVSVIEDQYDPEEAASWMQLMMRYFEELSKQSRKIPMELVKSVQKIKKPSQMADVLASQLNLNLSDKQQFLEMSLSDRVEFLCKCLLQEIELSKIEKRIHKSVRQSIEKNQKEYYLREQIRVIQKELGDGTDLPHEAEVLRSQLEKRKMPKEVKEKVAQEIARLEKMPPAFAETAVVRSYIEWMLALPWNDFSVDIKDINLAQKVLDQDHYGLDKVKERILEFLAVRYISDKVKGPILCLVGPAGVGKTSLGRSIANALGRKFARISLGGVRDEAEIRGHRRTYIGAMPGKIIQAMRNAGTSNPVILLDEVDKMSYDFRGDPSAALLEVLDPEVNHTFADHYIESPFDLSNVFFVITANVMSAIPDPLLDRMEVIQLPGYTEDEKLGIAKYHLWPKQTKTHGLESDAVKISDKAILSVIRGYTKEAGVRNLERNLAAICRKLALEKARGEKMSTLINPAGIKRYLKKPIYRYNQKEKESMVGVATGLAYTSVGGDILSIETSVLKGKGKLNLTGKLGEVMKESAQTALSVARANPQVQECIEDIDQLDIHIHVPEGAIPKDGPSAGVAMAVALISALTGKLISKDVAMTGEVTLRGRVLPIGGVKEKVLAAHRSGIKTVILPKENEKDLDEIPATVKRDMDFVLIEHVNEALYHAIVSDQNADEAAAGLDGMDYINILPDETWNSDQPHL